MRKARGLRSATRGFGVKEMKRFGIRFAVVFAAGVLGLAILAQPGRLMAQASIHGHVVNALGQVFPNGEVKLTKDHNPSASSKYEYTFPIDASGDYKGTDIAAGTYVAVAFQQGVTQDFIQAALVAGQDKQVDFDMTRKEYIDKLSPAEKDQIEQLKKQNSEAVAECQDREPEQSAEGGARGEHGGQLRCGIQGHDRCDGGQAGRADSVGRNGRRATGPGKCGSEGSA